MDALPTILSVVLSVAFLLAGGTKLAGAEPHPEEFERFGLPGLSPVAARLAVGTIETLAALLLLVGAISGAEGPAVVGAMMVLVTMVGALATHGRIGDPPPRLLPAGVLLVLAAIVIATA